MKTKCYLYRSFSFPLAWQHQTQMGDVFQVIFCKIIHEQKWWLSAKHTVLQKTPRRLYRSLRFSWTRCWAILARPGFCQERLNQMIRAVPSKPVFYNSMTTKSYRRSKPTKKKNQIHF